MCRSQNHQSSLSAHVAWALLGVCLLLLVGCGGGNGDDDRVPLDTVDPTVSITSFADGDTVGEVQLSVEGDVSDDTGVASVTVNGAAATVSGGGFSALVDLAAGDNTITVVATDAAGNSATVTFQVTLIAPLLAAATLSQQQVIPPSGSAASGSADIQVNRVTSVLSGTVTLQDLDAQTVSVLSGVAGTVGTIVLELEPGEDSGTWQIPAGTELTQAQIDAAAAGAFYVLAGAAGGEQIRGQLVPDGVTLIISGLDGGQQVPPLTPAGTGVGALTLDSATGLAQIHVNVTGTTSTILAGHIHRGFAGHATGDIRIGFVEDAMVEAGAPAHWFASDVMVSEEDLATLGRGELYYNIHTMNNPGGEVRGQVVPEGVTVFYSALGGGQVVGDGIVAQAVDTMATGRAATTVETATRTLTLYVNGAGLDGRNPAVTVNQAPAGQNGPAIAALDPVGDPALERWALIGFVASEAQFTAFGNQGLYALVTTDDFPAGELRGQLEPPGSSPVTDPAAFQLLSHSFETGERFSAFPDSISVTFSKPVLLASVSDASLFVQAADGDMVLDPGDPLISPVSAALADGDPSTVVLDFDGVAAGDDVYYLISSGDGAAPLTDQQGIIHDGDFDGMPGGRYMAMFVVGAPMQVASRNFEPGAVLEAFPSPITITFTEPVAGASLTPQNVFVEASGGDGTFGNGNETMLAPLTQEVAAGDPATVSLSYETSALEADTYRLYVVGTGAAPLEGADGLVVDGNGDGEPGGDNAASFVYDPAPAATVTLTQVQQQVFNPNCATAGCHDAATRTAGLNLSSGSAFDSLVNVASTFGDGIRVIPGNPDDSVLVRRLEGDILPQMPFALPPLDQELIGMVRTWIAEGAQDN